MLTHTPLLLLILLAASLLLAFFSASEAGILSVNRYRLKHLAKASKRAKRTQELLAHPDRLFGVILLGNELATITASSLATLLAVDFFGESIGVITTVNILLTFALVAFAEVSPKTWATLHPEKAAFSTSGLLQLLLRLFYPIVLLTNYVSNSFLRLLGISLHFHERPSLTVEELRGVVHEASGLLPSQHHTMLLRILDLEKVTVDDIMIPRTEVVGLDLAGDWDSLHKQLATTQHTFLPVYREDLHNVVGILHIKDALHLLAGKAPFDEKTLCASLIEPLFVPEGTSLTKQLLRFQKTKERFALVVDEYGDILGMITLEDILEEIVGEFTTNLAETYATVLRQPDNAYLVEGTTSLREFQRITQWPLPPCDAKTMNGMVITHLQMIPDANTCCLIGNLPIEVVQVQDNRIKTMKVFPPLARPVLEKKKNDAS